MKCDKIIELPNQHTVHGLRVQKFPKTGYVFCNGEDSVPIPNDGKSLTMPLVKGIKWSDGKPFTADDMMFYFEDFQFNKELSPTLATQWQPGRQPMTVTKVDAYTVKFDFAGGPAPSFNFAPLSAAQDIMLRDGSLTESPIIVREVSLDNRSKSVQHIVVGSQ